MIGVDWGTTSFRAFRLTSDGVIRDRRQGPRGILNVQDGRFADTLREEIGPWLAAGERHVLLSGAVGGRGGWIEAPLLPCPAGPAELARALGTVPFDWAEVKQMPGLTHADAGGAPGVIRSEAALVVGALAQIGATGLGCVPGSNSTWVRIEAGRIASFATHATGETFAALRGQVFPGRTIRDAPAGDLAAFDAGLARSGQPGGLLHHLFGVRSLALTGRFVDGAAGSFLWGLLIGHEVRAALAENPRGVMVHVIGAPELTALYARAIEAAGGMAERLNGEAIARGLALVGAAARWG
jgi:2-dehydro-3-deoxygalactonokinase